MMAFLLFLAFLWIASGVVEAVLFPSPWVKTDTKRFKNVPGDVAGWELRHFQYLWLNKKTGATEWRNSTIAPDYVRAEGQS